MREADPSRQMSKFERSYKELQKKCFKSSVGQGVMCRRCDEPAVPLPVVHSPWASVTF